MTTKRQETRDKRQIESTVSSPHLSYSPLLLCWPALLLLIAGCTAITHLRKHPGASSGLTAAPLVDDGYNDYVGVIHIHTTYSHDAMGTFEDAVRVANAQRLDYLITTDHNTLQPLRDGLQGWHGTTLVLIGTELSTRGGHYLALNVTKEIDYHKLTTQQIIDAVNRQGGLGFIAHPYFKKRRWTDWTVSGFTGVEGYNVAHDTLDENRFRLALWTLTAPAEPFYFSILDRPYDPIAKWDQLIQQHGKVVGIGSSDAHEIHVLGLKFAPYEVMFQMVRTHLLIPPGSLNPTLVYDALRKGHVYFAIELIAEAKGFSFLVQHGKEVRGIMGDAVAFEPDLQLTTLLPAAGQMTLFRDGQAIQTMTGETWQVPVTQPGVYRLEVTRHAKPWIFSNPVYIRSVDVPTTTPTPQTPPPSPTTP